MKKSNYQIFMIMLAASSFVMYSVMFLNVRQLDHIYLSTTRLYMTLLMVSPMAVIMLFFMRHMYKDARLNWIISGLSIVVFFASLISLRAQTLIGDKQYMKAMIPHHSSAILTSQEANITDPEVKALAKDIIDAQKREIAQMKRILARMD